MGRKFIELVSIFAGGGIAEDTTFLIRAKDLVPLTFSLVTMAKDALDVPVTPLGMCNNGNCAHVVYLAIIIQVDGGLYSRRRCGLRSRRCGHLGRGGRLLRSRGSGFGRGRRGSFLGGRFLSG